ncbi:hypothetical protein SCATT_p09630 (plasmid) [Streptantibioticus cattleyicolor NRRL 8057 = DSM 46488]|uniref:Uncharacterized protein n=2 Tax=Streptantibioticus cattleyicolor TaxID=29303 RepID=G8XDS2_STREN|nr:hypothetical protein SCATT_p09630 [Streptantibioticus cattleyicolor NRRL 8057 = DSM 46488]
MSMLAEEDRATCADAAGRPLPAVSFRHVAQGILAAVAVSFGRPSR